MNEPILSPKQYMQKAVQDFALLCEKFNGKSLLLCFDNDNFKNIISQFDTVVPSRDYQSVSILNKGKVAITGQTGIGAPAAVARCEELIACGIKRIISFGTCATLGPGIDIGDVVVCSGAYSDEGTSRQYYPSQRCFAPSVTLFKNICSHFQENKTVYKTAMAWTTDAPYRETPRRRELFRTRNCGVVEMEASALYMLGKYREVEMLSIFVVGDSIGGDRWDARFNEKILKDKLNTTAAEIVSFLDKSSGDR